MANSDWRNGFELKRMSFVSRWAYGVRMLGIRWAAGWNSVPKIKSRPFSVWVRRG